MKTTSILISLLLLTMANHNDTIYAKCFEPDSISLLDRRIAFVSISSGFPEFLSSRIGYQINNDWSGSVKISEYYDGVGGRMYLGTLIGGVKITRYFSPVILSINNISFELGYSKSGNNNNYAFDLSIGNESTRNIFLKPFWALSMSFIKAYDNKLYVTPGFKIGINFNF